MRFPRRAGILLHPTSLPGPEGIGTLGREAFEFVDFLAEAGQKLWQILPLLPLGWGNSPYSSPSAFAKNPLFINAESLVREGLLKKEDIKEKPAASGSRADYGAAGLFKREVLKRAWDCFRAEAAPEEQERFENFCARHAYWLDDYSLYLALKEQFQGKAWFGWPPEIARREEAAVARWKDKLKRRFHIFKFSQYLFFEQWRKLKVYANDGGIKIIGDIPFFISHDSADAWAHPQFFLLDDRGRLIEQSGVPPDSREKASQIWGTPLYRWETLRETGFEWWVKRLATAFELVDIVRLDHFYGFARCWHIPLDAKSSLEGRWVESPGLEIFQAVSKKLGRKPCIAEDLGYEPPFGIKELFQYTGFPGVRVFHYAFDTGPGNYHLPHNYIEHTVVYTGTHDHDTAVGWFKSRHPLRKKRILKYLGTDGREINWDLIRAALRSVARTAIIPLQDVLGLDSDARMNTPGKSQGQWEWRFERGALTDKVASRLRDLTHLFGR